MNDVFLKRKERPIISFRYKEKMGESIVPWDGVIEDPKFTHELEHAGNGMYLIKGTFSTQSYSCIIDTRNDTWFSLDAVQVQQGTDPVDSLNSSGNQSQGEAVSQQVQSPPSALSFQSAQNIPILPSYIDREGVDEKSVHGSEWVLLV